MKKITSILMLFLMCFGMAVQAGPTDLPELTTDLKNPKLYTIKNVRKSKFATYDKDDTKMTQQSTPVEASLFFFTGAINNGVATVKIHNLKADDKLCAETNSWTVEGRDWYIAAKTTTGLSISKSADFGGTQSWNDYQGDGQFVDYWSATDPGSIWLIESLGEQIDAAIEEINSKYVGSLKGTAETVSSFESYKKSIETGNHNVYFDFIAAKAKLGKKLPEAGKTYVVKNADPRFFANQHVEKALYAEGSKPMWSTVNLMDNKFYWAIVPKGNGYTLQNVKSKEYFKAFNAMSAAEADAATFTLKDLGGYQYNLNLEKSMHANNHGDGKNEGSNIVGWDEGLNSPSAWYIMEVNPIDVVYKYVVDNKVVYSQTMTQNEGEDFIVPYVNDGFVPTIVTKGKVSPTNKEVEVSCKENLPFIKTVDNKKPVLFSVRIKGSYLWNADVKTDVKATGTNDYFADFAKPAYQWYFMGNAVTGFKIYNVAQGNGVAVSKTDPIASFVDAESATAWKLKKSRTDEGKFCFNDGTTNLNVQGGVLKYWTDNDQGSSCDFFDIAYNFSNQVLDAAAIKDAPRGCVGYYKYFDDEVKAAEFNKVYVALQNNVYDETARQTLKDLVAAAQSVGKIEFNPALFYRLKNVARPTGTLTVDAGGVLTSEDFNIKNVDNIWSFKKLENGKFNLVNANYAKGVSAPGSHNLNETAVEYQIEDKTAGQFALKSGNYLVQYQDGPGKITQWMSASKDGDACWFLIPATELEVALNEVENATWASLHLPFDVTLPAELEAYTGKLNGSSLSMTKVADVPANNGVILKGKATKYNLTIEKAQTTVAENSLKGANVKMDNIDKNKFYILGNTAENGLGLYHPNATTLKANKAYLDLPVGVQVLKFDFTGETTGVEGVEVENESAKAVYYDLSGRRVENPAKGVYIKNGKKVYVK